MTFKLTRHAAEQARLKGFTREQITSALTRPEAVTRVTAYPGQRRYCGAGVACVVDPQGWVITMYADKILTPPRPDQLTTPQGKRYAQRYSTGKGRG